MRILKFNEVRIKGIIDNLNGILVEFKDNNIDYNIEPSSAKKILNKSIINGTINYGNFYLKIEQLSYNEDYCINIILIIDRIEMIIDYMNNEGFKTIIYVGKYRQIPTLTSINDIKKNNYSEEGLPTMQLNVIKSKRLDSIKLVFIEK